MIIILILLVNIIRISILFYKILSRFLDLISILKTDIINKLLIIQQLIWNVCIMSSSWFHWLIKISINRIYVDFINFFTLFWEINLFIFKCRDRRSNLYLLRFHTLLLNFRCLLSIENLLSFLDGEALLVATCLEIDTLEIRLFFIIFSSLWNRFSQRSSSGLFTLWLIDCIIILS